MAMSRWLGIQLVTREAACDGLSSLRATGPGSLFGQPIERLSRVYQSDLIRHPDGCPALVLNADYTPLS